MMRAKVPQAVITFLDAEAKKNQGRENVLFRRMLAEVLLESKKTGLAVSQLQLILEIKAEDDSSSAMLIKAYDTLGQPAEALEYVSRQT